MIVAGTALAVGLGWASQSVLAEPGGELVAITGATIFDATGKDPYRGTVVVRGGRIDAVGADVKAPKGAKIVRADGKALLPGFIDVPTPWSTSGSPAALPQLANAYLSRGVPTVNASPQQPQALPPAPPR